MVRWQDNIGQVEYSKGVALNLCGSTAIIIASSVALVVAVVGEERASGVFSKGGAIPADHYLTKPKSVIQQASVSISQRVR
jgi:hypothetical protein